MMFRYFLASVLFCLVSIQTGFGLSIDSSNRFLSFQFNRRAIHSIDLNRFSTSHTFTTGYPITNNYINSFSLIAQKRIYSFKKFHLNAYSGLTAQLMKIGTINTMQASRNINETLNYRSYMFGFNASLSIDRTILKFKNNSLAFGAGLWSNGIFYNKIKTHTIVLDRNDIYGKDSMIIDFKRNRFFYVSPFFQLTLKTKYKNKVFISGIKVIYPASNGGDIATDFRFFVTKFPYNPGQQHYGPFSDDSLQFVLFFGLLI